MTQSAALAIGAAALIACLGLWWFIYVAPGIKKMPAIPRYGVYAALWLAYFILSIIVIGQVQ